MADPPAPVYEYRIEGSSVQDGGWEPLTLWQPKPASGPIVMRPSADWPRVIRVAVRTAGGIWPALGGSEIATVIQRYVLTVTPDRTP